MKAIQPGQTREYVCQCDRELPKDKQTVFVLCRLTRLERAHLRDAYPMGMGTTNLTAFHLGVKAVKNFFDEKGNPVELVRDPKGAILPGGKKTYTDESMSRIPKDAFDEVAAEIINEEGFEEAVAKNS